MRDLDSKAKSFEPYLAKVDEICEAVSQIEQTVVVLDDYTMRCATACLACACYFSDSPADRLEAKFASAGGSSPAKSPAGK